MCGVRCLGAWGVTQVGSCAWWVCVVGVCGVGRVCDFKTLSLAPSGSPPPSTSRQTSSRESSWCEHSLPSSPFRSAYQTTLDHIKHTSHLRNRLTHLNFGEGESANQCCRSKYITFGTRSRNCSNVDPDPSLFSRIHYTGILFCLF